MDNHDFYTFREYMYSIDKYLTASMEDYLEMIYRLCKEKGYTRMNELSSALNVQPPAATRMVQKLAKMKLVQYQKYGVLTLEELGEKMGASLLIKHKAIEDFLRTLGINEENILEETEKIEHTISHETMHWFSVLVDFLRSRKDIWMTYEEFKKKNAFTGQE